MDGLALFMFVTISAIAYIVASTVGMTSVIRRCLCVSFLMALLLLFIPGINLLVVIAVGIMLMAGMCNRCDYRCGLQSKR